MLNGLTVAGFFVVAALAAFAAWAHRRGREAEPTAEVFDFQLAHDLRDARGARTIRKASAYREWIS